jgi:hypothetical protein
MQVQPDDFQVLHTIARYYVLTREQIQQICFPKQASGRGTRKRLLRLRNAGFIKKHSVPVALPMSNSAAPVYYPTQNGSEALASFFDDECWLATNTRSPRADRLSHWIAINSTRLVIEQAVAAQDVVKLDGWITEWEVINKNARPPHQFVLHSQLSETPPLSCSPDAAFVLSVRGFRKVFYLEQDQGTSSPKQVASRKAKGYAEAANILLHRTHFPTTNAERFSVLVVTPSQYRCRAIGEAVSRQLRSDIWLMACQKDLTIESFLNEPIIYSPDGTLAPLIKSKTTLDVTVSQAATVTNDTENSATTTTPLSHHHSAVNSLRSGTEAADD